MKINSLLQEGITTSSSPDNAQSPAPHFGRSDKVLEDSIEECTTSGSVATVASPVGGVQRRGKGSIFSGIKTSDKFANSQAVKEETTDEGFLGFGSDAPAQPKKKLDYAAARRMSQQANPKMTKQYHPDEYIKKYGAFAEEDELDENSMADFFAKAAQEKFPNALIRKNGETVQEPPKREIPQQAAPQAPVDVAELEKQYAALEKRYEQLGGDSWQYADRMMDRDYEARDVGRQLRVLADRIQKAKGIEEARKANTKTARKGLAKREKRVDPTMDAKKQSEQDAAWERLQAYMNNPENKEVLQRLATKEGVAEGEEMSTFAALKDWQVWNVHVFNNYYRGKYADYGPRLYSVVASSPEEARQVVIKNPDYVLQDLLSRKLVSGKKVLPRGSALPVTPDRVGKAEPGSITTMAFKKMLTPDGVQSFKFTNGKIVDGAHVQGGEVVDEAQWWPDREYIPKTPRKRKPQVGNRVMDISVGSPKIYYKGGKAVGEVGIDPEASPGNGSYYMKHYLSGRDMGGYDTPLEASKELSHLVRQESQGVAESSFHNPYGNIKFLNKKTGEARSFYYWASVEGRQMADSMVTNNQLVPAHDDGTEMSWEEFKQALTNKNKGAAEDQLDEKSVSKAQFRTMAAVAHNPEFAKKVGISQKVGKEFHKADKKSDYAKLPSKVDEAEIAEDKLASELYKDLQIFKKGADKDIGNRPKDKDIGNKPSDKEVQKKK